MILQNYKLLKISMIWLGLDIQYGQQWKQTCTCFWEFKDLIKLVLHILGGYLFLFVFFAIGTYKDMKLYNCFPVQIYDCNKLLFFFGWMGIQKNVLQQSLKWKFELLSLLYLINKFRKLSIGNAYICMSYN
jgi:hypothetical protein